MLLIHVRRTLGTFSNGDCEIFNEKNAIRLIIAGFTSILAQIACVATILYHIPACFIRVMSQNAIKTSIFEICLR